MKLMRCQNGPAVLQDGEAVLFSEINAKRGVSLPDSLLALIQGGSMEALRDLRGTAGLQLSGVTPLLRYRGTTNIWCSGLVYNCETATVRYLRC